MNDPEPFYILPKIEQGMESVLIFGGNGYFAQAFKKHMPSAQRTLEDITDPVKVRTVLDTCKPTVVLNCAGKTGKPNVDWCETHQEETWRSNVLGPLCLAEACAERNIILAQISSGCIYEGDNAGKGFGEEDPPNFFGSYYSRSKIAAEKELASYNNILLVRPRMPIDPVPGPRNFITKINKYQKVISVPNSMSIIDDFVRATQVLIQQRKTGTYNVVNPGVITHQEILDMYRAIVDPNFTYTLMTLEELHQQTAAKRSNCVLSTKKLQEEGIHLPEIHAAVEQALQAYKEQYKNSS